MAELDLDSFAALLFDLDGTLADTMPLHNQAWIETLQEYGYPMTAEILMEYAGVSNVKTVEIFNKRFNWNLNPQEIAHKKESNVTEKLKELSEPVAATFAIVKKYSGKKPMAIVSGGAKVQVENILRRLNLLQYFSVLITAESTERGKPFPDPFLMAAEKLNVSPKDCVVFEDGAAGIKAAQACEMKIVFVGTDFSLKWL